MRVRAYADDEAEPFPRRLPRSRRGVGLVSRADDLCELDGLDGFGLETVNIHAGVRFHTAFAYLDPVRRRSRCSIARSSTVSSAARMAGGPTSYATTRR